MVRYPPQGWQPEAEELRQAEEALLRWKESLRVPQKELALREAVASSRIEGIDPSHSPRLVLNLADAYRVLPFLKDRPLDWLAQEVHALLFREVPTPFPRGRYRTIPVWIGGLRSEEALCHPPHPLQVPGLMEKWREAFTRREAHPLVDALVLHATFEAIHPFPDGNGRVGRALIQAYLLQRGVLEEETFPLPLSEYLWRHRSLYYQSLYQIDTFGDWNPWADLFLKGIQTLSLGE